MYLPLLAELKRRRVLRAVGGYAVGAFAALQVIEPVMHGLHWPDAVLSAVVIALAAGFPIVVALAWIFDAGPGGIERTPPTAGVKRRHVALVVAAAAVLAAMPVAWHFAASTRAASPGGPLPSVAVLPFTDMSPGKDQEYFSDGMAEEVLSALSQVEGLQVAGRTSSFAFKGRNEDLRSIGQKLGVETVLEGSVRKAGNRVRISAQLIKAADGFHLWSQAWDREVTDVFAVQDEIARMVVEALQIKLLAGRQPTTKPRRTANVEAYSQYLAGRLLYGRMTTDTFHRAKEAFEKALALDPGYAPAHASLSTLLRDQYGRADTAEAAAELRRRSLAEADLAVSLGPELADGWAARGLLRMTWSRDWNGAESDFARAMALNPGDARGRRRMGLILAIRGRLDDAAAELRRATELDPLDTPNWLWLGAIYQARGDLATDRKLILRALEVAPESEDAHNSLAIVSLLAGDPAAALAESRFVDDHSRLWIEALAEHSLGHGEESQRALNEYVAKHAHNAAAGIADVYAWKGDADRAFEWLQRALEQESSFVKIDPFLATLHGDPRWAALLERMNLPPG